MNEDWTSSDISAYRLLKGKNRMEQDQIIKELEDKHHA